MNAQEKARELILTVNAELARGVEHYDLNGKRLKTTMEILIALGRDKRIEIKEPAVRTFSPQPDRRDAE